jgi:Retrotransposon gag protein
METSQPQPRNDEPGLPRDRAVDADFVSKTKLAAIWRPRGTNPNELLKGQKHAEYGPWRYAVDCKLITDYPMYPDDDSKISYALSQMETPIFDAMLDWVVDGPRAGPALFNDLMEEVEHYMGFHLLERQAKRDLRTIVQNPSESISQYYHRIRPLWQRAKTPESDRIDQFMTIMLPGIFIGESSNSRSGQELLEGRIGRLSHLLI